MKKVMIILGTLCFLLVSFFFINDVVLKDRIFVRETYIKDATIPTTFDGVRVVQFSDAKIASEDDLTTLENLIAALTKINPDILIFTGDLFGSAAPSDKLLTKTQDLLTSIQVPIAKVAVLGDQDLESKSTSLAQSVLESSHFSVLQNEVMTLHNGTHDAIQLVGLNPLETLTDLDELLAPVDHDLFSILLMHEPNLAPLMTEYPINLQLSGHCLGNQETSANDAYRSCEQFTSGNYYFANELTLHVNEGLQAKASRQTLFIQPTIHSFLLLKEKSS